MLCEASSHEKSASFFKSGAPAFQVNLKKAFKSFQVNLKKLALLK
jgi:hypothetical protein